MAINFKKSCCMRIGPRCDINCAKIGVVSSTGKDLPSVTDIRYLGMHIVRSTSFKCSLDMTKRSFYRASNVVFGKIGRSASEEVVLKIIHSKCVPILLYGLEACPLNKADFVINRFFKKLFKTSNLDIVRYYQEQFCSELPSVILARRITKFEVKFGNLLSNKYK